MRGRIIHMSEDTKTIGQIHADRIKEALLQEHNERNRKIKAIQERWNDSRRSHIEDVIIINDDYQIAEIIRREDGNTKTIYSPCLNFEPTDHYAHTIEQAMLLAIAFKYGDNRGDSAFYAGRVLGLKDAMGNE